MVWVPRWTGSHIGGRWVEVSGRGHCRRCFEREKSYGEQLQREMRSMGNPNTGN